ncbi:hypothetical protein E2C01_021286 [Portunus trituberculatus]|uniref:Uncharacterized protein n=1 Tax=Portunus trituberculatus TaxID=210409 RepID=A0A5B7E2A6_PORTR|nr:hypothetical protein [Portunus trituberculatus]
MNYAAPEGGAADNMVCRASNLCVRTLQCGVSGLAVSRWATRCYPNHGGAELQATLEFLVGYSGVI